MEKTYYGPKFSTPKDAIQTWSMETIKEPPDAKDQSVTVILKLSLSDLFFFFFLQSVNVMRLLGCVGTEKLEMNMEMEVDLD